MKKMSQISRHSRRWKTRKAMSLFCLLLMTVLFASAVLATAEESGSLPVPPAASAPSQPQSEPNISASTPQGDEGPKQPAPPSASESSGAPGSEPGPEEGAEKNSAPPHARRTRRTRGGWRHRPAGQGCAAAGSRRG